MKRFFLILLFLVGLALVAFSGWQLIEGHREYATARTEYADLRTMVPSALPPTSTPTGPARPPSSAPESVVNPMTPFLEINPDFVGWIQVNGTAVDYPVVRGADNELYLHTTFTGTNNASGAIFMDYRSIDGFDAPAAVLYGHNMRDGSMFASLHQFLDPEFTHQYSEIAIITADGAPLVYRVFDAQLVSARDALFGLDFNDAGVVGEFFGVSSADRILVLSTCESGSNRDWRLVVFAVLVEAV
ncbi:MAG: class B sortase [Oscillospiraceae bacterium]|nr:class B sortase [Oscillospiraceae bacterium]